MCILLILLFADEEPLVTNQKDQQSVEAVEGAKAVEALKAVEEEKPPPTEAVRAEDDFAGRRRRLDGVCKKYDDLFRPERYSLYRKG